MKCSVDDPRPGSVVICMMKIHIRTHVRVRVKIHRVVKIAVR